MKSESEIMIEKVKHLLFHPVFWIMVNAICLMANFNYFVFGNSYGIKWINLPVSIMYMVYMVLFACKGNNRFIVIIGIIYVVLGLLGFPVSKYAMAADWLIAPSILFIAPYSGINHLIKSKPLCWVLYAGFGTVLMIIAIIRRKMDNRF